MTKIICSSVIRASQRGDSHGGIYVVDIDTEAVEQILDWDRPDIDWEGRGGDRGIRSMQFYKDELYAIAGNAVMVFNRDMKLIREFTNSYLRHTHDCSLVGDLLYVIANKYDAILILDLKNQKWLESIHFQRCNGHAIEFDPFLRNSKCPNPDSLLHLDSISVNGSTLFYSGEGMLELMTLNLDTKEQKVCQENIPHTHNAQPYKDGTIYNIARKHKTIYKDSSDKEIWVGNTPLYKENEMVDKIQDEAIAIQGYTRGMCLIDDYIIVGSAPATINVFTLKNSKPLKSIRISKDVRNSICGISQYEW